MIYETLVTTLDASGQVHLAPFGIRQQDDLVILAPYRPSKTLENILATETAVINYCDNVILFAQAVIKMDSSVPFLLATAVNGFRIQEALAHEECSLVHIVEDNVRPQLHLKKVFQANHAPFRGFNRAQAAVIELAVLTSRLTMLPQSKIVQEMTYLQIAVEKTAGDREWTAWQLLKEFIEKYYQDAAY